MTDINKLHQEQIQNVLKESLEKLSKITPHVIQSKQIDLPKFKAAQIGGPDIDMEVITDKNGKVHYVKKK